MDFKPVYKQDARTEEEAKILQALEQVIDPEIGFDVVNLGLIYGLDVTDDAVNIKMTMTFQGCPLMDYMVGLVREAVNALNIRPQVVVDLTFDPPWSPQYINPALMGQGAQ
ncbi:metal-sulfur cluster assembly factor [Coprothermobacteraceae bacterium]|nr:metal-sulfur cluster assembly factor [Coprothermobacteraceae bacterium]